MRISKVSFGFTKPTGVYANEKIMIEVELNDHECEQKALTLAKSTAETFFKENNQHLFVEDVIVEVEQPKKSVEDGYLFLINNSTSLNELKMYEILANNVKYPNLKESYNKRLKELID